MRVIFCVTTRQFEFTMHPARSSILVAVCIAAFFFPVKELAGQSLFQEIVQDAYGLDQNLVNGIQYDNRYIRCQGDPYFLGNGFNEGSVTIAGIEYPEVLLKYDLVAQHLEIEYRTFTGGVNRLILVTDPVEKFFLGTYEFQRVQLPGFPPRFCQVINTGKFTCLVFWSKSRIPLNNSVQFTEQITKARRNFWLLRNDSVQEFSNRRSFVACFAPEVQKDIRRMLRRRNFVFRTSDQEELVRSMQAVAALLQEGGGK